MTQKKNAFDPSKLAFWIAIAFVVFIVGGEFSLRGWQPWKLYNDGLKNAKALIKQTFDVKTRPWTLEKHRYDGDGVVSYDKLHAQDGFTIIQGLFAEGVELRLLDMAGNVIHRWHADFFKIWPNPKHVKPSSRIPATDFNYDIHGMWLLQDGSVVFNFSELGSVKLDKCGKVLWTIDRSTHHSVTANPDGTFWIPEKHDPADVPDNLLLFNFTRKDFMQEGGEYEDRLLLVAADGKIKQELSVLQALVDGGFYQQLFDAGKISKMDPTHVNDIEVVTTALANKINGVNTGDLLVSVRQLHMLVIMDKNTGKIKWHQTGPWIRQHDPDITAQGTIEVFNNNVSYAYADNSDQTRMLTGSNIISFDPATGKANVIYPLAGQKSFYSEIQGAHQLLDNGNRLIVESRAGRVFEIDKSGNIVWDYIKRYDDTYTSWIENAIRYNKDYFTVSSWDCPKTSH